MNTGNFILPVCSSNHFLFRFQNVYVLPWTESEEYGDFLKRLEDPLVWNGSDKGGDDVGAALGPLSPRHLVSEGNISASSQIHTLKESKFQFTTLSFQYTGIIVIYGIVTKSLCSNSSNYSFYIYYTFELFFNIKI